MSAVARVVPERHARSSDRPRRRLEPAGAVVILTTRQAFVRMIAGVMRWSDRRERLWYLRRTRVGDRVIVAVYDGRVAPSVYVGRVASTTRVRSISVDRVVGYGINIDHAPSWMEQVWVNGDDMTGTVIRDGTSYHVELASPDDPRVVSWMDRHYTDGR